MKKKTVNAIYQFNGNTNQFISLNKRNKEHIAHGCLPFELAMLEWINMGFELKNDIKIIENLKL